MQEDFQNFKEQVRSAADIVEVISAYVPLKKRGQNFWGCCPFHGEKTPSFSVNPGRNMFYCFGCHEGGDIFKFIMKVDNCTFMEAAKTLAGKYNIPIPEKQKTAVEIKREQKSKSVYEANLQASRFFQACLLRTEYGKGALAYLQKRGISLEIINSFGIGYALNRFDALLVSLGRKQLAPQLLEEAGLLAKGKTHFYDKFRNRVMIPIKDARGNVVGFGGRVLDDSTPKYLNTAETEWFNKRRILFGMDIALKAIRAKQQAIVVEGYMDAISLHAAGINNVVASMGTAFAEEQAKLLAKAAPEVVFCYDSDAAGRRASVRAVGIAMAAGLKVRIAGVPDGKDPDEFVRAHGTEAFQKVIADAKEGIDFQVEETISQNNISDLAGKVKTVSNVLPFLRECKSEIEVAEHIRKLAQRLTIDEALIVDEYRKQNRRGGAVQNERMDSAPVEHSGGTQSAEELLLAILLEHPTYTIDCLPIVQEIGFQSQHFTQIFNNIYELACQDCMQFTTLHDILDGGAQAVLARIASYKLPEGNLEQIVNDCLKQMKRTYLEKEYEKHRLLAVEYEQSSDERFISELMESQRIQNEIKKLYGSL